MLGYSIGLPHGHVCLGVDTLGLTMDGCYTLLHIGCHSTANTLIQRVFATEHYARRRNAHWCGNRLHLPETATILCNRHVVCGLYARSTLHVARHIQIWAHSHHNARHHSSGQTDGARERRLRELRPALLRVGRRRGRGHRRKVVHRALDRVASASATHGAERRWTERKHGYDATALGAYKGGDGRLARTANGWRTIDTRRRGATAYVGYKPLSPLLARAGRAGSDESGGYHGGVDTYWPMER